MAFSFSGVALHFLAFLFLVSNVCAHFQDPRTSNFFVARNSSSCKCIPGDACWPSVSDWAALNETVKGRLVATVPLGSPCHDPNYNATECAYLQEKWTDPSLHLPSSSSAMAPFYANRSCDPFTPRNTSCLLGNYVDYAINVSTTADVAAGLAFVQKHNIRLVVRNTGHDYLGKSTGAFALGIWTHYLKTIEFIDYNTTAYTGKAVKLGAGVAGEEATAAGLNAGYQVVGGECATVGIAGGYSQSGGHSVLSSYHGLGADQTLEFEVVLANGSVVKASATENSDLYWAMSGGGGGTYGISVSLTSKAYPDTNISAAWISFNASSTTNETYQDMISLWHSLAPAITSANGTAVYYSNPVALIISPVAFPATSLEKASAIISPFINKLNSLNITHTYNLSSFSNYSSFFKTAWPSSASIGVSEAQYGSYLIPRSTFTNSTARAALSTAITAVNAASGTYIGVMLDVSRFAAPSLRAVLPAWRSAYTHSIFTLDWSFDPAAWDQMIADQHTITNVFIPKLKALAPNSGAYVNEGDGNQPDWKEAFWGQNYDKLLDVKSKYDPKGIFYANRAVGSDAWELVEGRLCRSG